MTLQLHFKGNIVILVMLIRRQIHSIVRNLLLFIIIIIIIIIIIPFLIISLFIDVQYTTVSKVVLQKRKSVRDNTERLYG